MKVQVDDEFKFEDDFLVKKCIKLLNEYLSVEEDKKIFNLNIVSEHILAIQQAYLKTYTPTIQEETDYEYETTSDMQNKFNTACVRGDLKVVKELINDPNVDPAYYTNMALHDAVGAKRYDVVRFLLKDKRVDLSDRGLETSAIPVENNDFKMLEILIKEGKMSLEVALEVAEEEENYKIINCLKKLK